MADGDYFIIIAIMLLLIATGIVGVFNLGERVHPALSTAFQGSGINMFWTVILRLVIGPLMIVVPSYIIYNIFKEMI